MTKKLNNILISNDDGYESVGLKVLLNIAEQLADNVLIVSPTYLWGLLNTLRVFLRDSDMSRKTQIFIKEIGLIGKDIERLADRTADIEKKFNLISDQFRNVKVSADKIQSRAEKLQQIENVEAEVEELAKK